ncbi:hypothetical protein HanIR_Chr04g0186681 [Helianthus annuus]|nr:hypothetical protein HanIR_Chr04g0186681 [Helianthus annuus]
MYHILLGCLGHPRAILLVCSGISASVCSGFTVTPQQRYHVEESGKCWSIVVCGGYNDLLKNIHHPKEYQPHLRIDKINMYSIQI